MDYQIFVDQVVRDETIDLKFNEIVVEKKNTGKKGTNIKRPRKVCSDSLLQFSHELELGACLRVLVIFCKSTVLFRLQLKSCRAHSIDSYIYTLH